MTSHIVRGQRYAPFARRKKGKPAAIYVLGLGTMLMAPAARAQIITDGTMGPAGALRGPNYQIPAELGQKLGRNLFHSFADFQLYAGQSATFSGPTSVRNILSRVTGGTPSLLDGQLNSSIAGANFFFINPAGMVFGPDVQLNVSGSFVATSADVVKLGQSGSFNALNPAATVLTSASPSAFGFLTPNQRPILLTGAAINAGEQKSVALIGNGVGLLDESAIAATGGNIDLVSVGSVGEVKLNVDKPFGINVSSFSKMGRIEVSGNSKVVAVDEANIRVRGENILVDGPSSLLLKFTGDIRSQVGIDIRATGDVILTNGGAVISEALSKAKGSDIFISANQLALGPGGVVLTNTGTSDGGTTPRDPARTGDGGDIRIRAGAIFIENTNPAMLSGIASEVEPFGVGNGGNLDIEAEKIQILGASLISTNSRGSGNSGTIVIKASDIELDRGSASGVNGITAQTQAASNAGKGGNVLIRTDQLTLAPGSQISASTLGSGVGGEIKINANTLIIDSKGKGNSAGVTTGIIAVSSAETGGGPAGGIKVRAGEMRILNGALVSSTTLGNGAGGQVQIEADSLLISGAETFLGSNSQSPRPDGGKSGNILLKTGQLTVAKGALVSAGTDGDLAGGTITIESDTLIVDGQDATSQTAIASETGGAGSGGDIKITARDVRIVNGGSLTTNTYASGQGGKVSIVADKITLDGRDAERFTGITATTTAEATGIGGDIKIESRQVEVNNGATISSSTLGVGKGGKIEIAKFEDATSVDVTLDNGNIASVATESGDAGSIKIADGGVVDVRGGRISVSSAQSDAGVLNIEANDIFLTDGVIDSLAEGTSPDGTPIKDKGNGGDVILRATKSLVVQGGSLSAQALRNGGNIDAIADRIIFDRSQILANASLGNGGNISLRSKIYLPSAESIIDASSEFGVAGNVVIDSPNTNVGGSLISLPSNVLDAESFLAARCVVRGTNAASSFTVNPPNGVPAQLGDLLPSPTP